MVNLILQEQEKNMRWLCESNESLNDWFHEIAKLTYLTSGYTKVYYGFLHKSNCT